MKWVKVTNTLKLKIGKLLIANQSDQVYQEHEKKDDMKGEMLNKETKKCSDLLVLIW